MKNGWEPGGLLLLAWAEVRIAIAARAPEDSVNRPIQSKALEVAGAALDAAIGRASCRERV